MKLPKARQGFSIVDNLGRKNYFLVINVTIDDVEYIRVRPIADDKLNISRVSYDDAQAVYPRDKDNVYLRDCPPPFSELSFPGENGQDINNACAIAVTENDVLKPMSMSMFEFEACAEIIDNEACISKRDMEIVKNHPYLRQIQKGKTFSENKAEIQKRRLADLGITDSKDEIPDFSNRSVPFEFESLSKDDGAHL